MDKDGKLLMINDKHFPDRYEIRKELRSRGLVGKKAPRTLEDVPGDLRHKFEMRKPDFYV